MKLILSQDPTPFGNVMVCYRTPEKPFLPKTWDPVAHRFCLVAALALVLVAPEEGNRFRLGI